ncbi:aminotransferase class V-fold PLP-dependent enzyme [Clostridium folliculivorans]|uniref:cysteine desulfurase n=1 Tax=Clostridium folliculivorans TaxID=2886038 RepID=A0A9W6DBB8_9CLOT|nr:aminotransferase class V-fold PLP-dependent enzyme [Clostridium folliculivorans]GKU25831.1 cysteine desulfurase [Clostridium folliculivorans]GKU27917.1 cysteine desulfurase [Clostridium folliculivorans]
MSIYFDNASTSFPKPDTVSKSIYDFIVYNGGNAGRGASTSSLKSSELVYECREALCNFFNFDKTENVIFTQNITFSLNMLLLGAIKDGWHVITSSMEHNSVLRPLTLLKDQGKIQLDIVQCDENGIIDENDIKSLIKENTKLIVLSHASNVIGSIQSLESIGKICKYSDILFIVDSAQSAGSTPVDFKSLNCDALAFTGHKGLLGPQGIGGFLINDKLNESTIPTFTGGTGSMSSSLTYPDYLPDKFECGTLNLPGIVGLKSGLEFIQSVGIDTIQYKELMLTKRILEILNGFKKINVYGFKDIEKRRTSTVSFNILDRDPSEISFILDKQYGIITRTGLHCAPLAHKTIGTFPTGTVRISLGYFNSLDDAEALYKSIKYILGGY